MKIDCDHIGYEVSWEDSLLDVVDNFIHRVFQRTVRWSLIDLLVHLLVNVFPNLRQNRVS